MRIPQSLHNAKIQLEKARLATKKEVDEDSMRHLESIINAAQPGTDEERTQQKLIKGMYNDDKNGFLRFVRGKSFEPILLWTESRAIINYLGLRNIVYIRWDNEARAYVVSKFVKREEPANAVLSTIE